MRTIFSIVSLCGAAMVCAQEVLPDRVEFNRDIRPILSNNCFLCHGFDKSTREAGLRLDIRDEAISNRNGVTAIVPHDVDASELIARITSTNPNDRMPPTDTELDLSDHEIALLTKWIDQGADYQEHWAYISPKKKELPKLDLASWPRNAIDHFVLARLEEESLSPSAEAERVTLIRRLSFDLIGLPPTPEEVDTFVYDSRPDAYERVVDRLLASPHFGERLAIYWLDLVRYADTVGFHGDQVRGASGYRDYVINAFNANMPFDQFTRENLAGDLIDNPTQDQLLASGYNRLNMVTREGGAQEGDYIVRYAADRVRTTASVWLGSSLACAQCHDHKYDPFSMKDFYSFGAFFADIKEKGVQTDGGNEAPFPPFLKLPTDDQQQKIAEIDARLAAVAAEAKEERESLLAERKRAESAVRTSVVTETMEPRTMRVLARGSWQDESGEIVSPMVPAFLGLIDGDDRPTRLDLAKWLTSGDNPLTARVFVNRLWYLYFGTGISKRLDDLGSQGEWPTHPELLDHLAVDFMESGWDIKHSIKQIVTSAAYRQSSVADQSLMTLDPYNRLIARQSRIRHDAEIVRDNALKVAGLLNLELGGRSVFPYQPAGYYRELNFPTRTYEADTDDSLYRRGVYIHWQRTFLHPSLLAFDAPTREECTAERPVSNSPQQALALLNDPIFVEAARALAERILTESNGTARGGITFAFKEALSRAPSTDELSILTNLFNDHHREFGDDTEAANALIATGASKPNENLDPALLAAWTSVSRAVINLHEMMYRY